MASRKQRELLRIRRMEFDRRVEENRRNMEKFAAESVKTDKGRKMLDSMTKQELIAYAYENEIEVDKRAKKSDILEAIKKVG